MAEFIKIDPKILADLYRNKPNETRTYFDSNKLIQSIYWNRLRYMIDRVKHVNAKRVLDLGCGSGVLLPTLSKKYPEVYGIDLNTHAAERIVDIYKLKNVHLYEQDIFEKKFTNDFYDIIFAASVLEHFSDQSTLFKELRRIIRPGGVIVFSSPNDKTGFYQLARYIFNYVRPDDHYYSVFKIAEYASTYFEYSSCRRWPLNTLLPKNLSLYAIFVFKKPI